MTQYAPLDDSLPLPGPASQQPGANNPPSAIEMARDQWKAINSFLSDNPAIVDETAARQAKLVLDRGKATVADLEAARRAKVDPLNAEVANINDIFRRPREALNTLVDIIKKRLTDYALAEEAKRKAEAERLACEAAKAERLAREAEAREKEAMDNAAVGEVVDVGAATEQADQAFDAFKSAERQADRAERDSHVRIGGGFTRAAGLRTKKTLVLDDAAKALACLGVTDDIREGILKSARAYKALHKNLPDGVSEIEERTI